VITDKPIETLHSFLMDCANILQVLNGSMALKSERKVIKRVEKQVNRYKKSTTFLNLECVTHCVALPPFEQRLCQLVAPKYFWTGLKGSHHDRRTQPMLN
jgi:hypothetical protein